VQTRVHGHQRVFFHFLKPCSACCSDESMKSYHNLSSQTCPTRFERRLEVRKQPIQFIINIHLHLPSYPNTPYYSNNPKKVIHSTPQLTMSSPKTVLTSTEKIAYAVLRTPTQNADISQVTIHAICHSYEQAEAVFQYLIINNSSLRLKQLSGDEEMLKARLETVVPGSDERTDAGVMWIRSGNVTDQCKRRWCAEDSDV
jgi:hypothetical protein